MFDERSKTYVLMRVLTQAWIDEKLIYFFLTISTDGLTVCA